MIIQSETTAALQINFCIIFDNIFFIFESPILQGSAERRSPGLVTFVTALAYHFCPALPAAFTQPGDHLLEENASFGELPRPNEAEEVSKSRKEFRPTTCHKLFSSVYLGFKLREILTVL